MRAMDISSYVAGNKLKIKAEEQRRLDFYKVAREKAKKVAKTLRDSFPNIEVYLFGSLTTDMYELESDIDIAVKGLLEENYFKAYRIAEDIAEPIPLDFIQFEFAQESMQERIVRDGVRI
ncbi:nucleotidyltransferase family protein [Desulfosporosinus sp. BICA1-9]|uniref:nucleotidyltransferase family protein n=1 Tax=Desulfosporosinus sp. BICA1-9 TaxID=1531958 RepID=UPI00054B7976|nr:nucleotidyltransferase domain-containing protein [Desulfosporosinus sp. BICA1-9]KJS46133.1 MAG: nucleotidyltransferase [Peptococcaceae bacterium BRH_c23]KJS83724.1 MAG: nucleotidyltransferase [Desulfosporosinus sp. BICA1-9]HBW33928.1 nucleotidyltransferase domain-containing protein [Desulfosporosinus sp.]